MNKLHILLISQQYQKIISGIGTHTSQLINSLTQDGHKVTLITPSDQFISSQIKDLEIITIPISPFRSHIRWIIYSYFFGKVANNKLSNTKIDLIHFTDAREALFLKAGIPVVGNVNDIYLSEINRIGYYLKNYNDGLTRWTYYLLARQLEKISYKKINEIIANSVYTAKTIQSIYKIEAKKINICYKSIDIQNFKGMSSISEKMEKYPARILFVGNNFQRKGLRTLIQSSVEVLKHFPETEFWIVGEDKMKSKFENLCKELGVYRSFIFWGLKSQEELVKIYNKATIFVLPSLTEAFGVVFLEAMACGLVVIGTEVGGIPEIIKNGYNGVLVPPNQPQKLANAIVAILSNKNLAIEYMENGIRTIKNFSTEHMMKCTYEVYQKALSNGEC